MPTVVVLRAANVFGVPATTRSWTTLLAVVRKLGR